MCRIYCLFIYFFFVSKCIGAIENVLAPPFIDSLYKEDQFYLRLNYTQVGNNIQNSDNSFPYSISGGFILDIPFNKNRNIGLGLGLGCNFSNYEINPIFDNYIISGITTKNIINTHSLEFPIELRWRTSTPTTFSFWRIYTGLLLEYTWSNTVIFRAHQSQEYRNFNEIEPFKVNLTISAGHGQWNINTIIGLTNLVKKSHTIGNIDSKPFGLGLIFYIL